MFRQGPQSPGTCRADRLSAGSVTVTSAGSPQGVVKERVSVRGHRIRSMSALGFMIAL